MPKGYNNSWVQPFLAFDINVNGGSATGGAKKGWEKVGTQFAATDSYLTHRIPRAYTGRSWQSVVVKKATTGQPGYYPDFRYAEIPFFGDSFTTNSTFAIELDRAWSKLMDQVKGNESSLGATLGEGYEALNMIASRAYDLRMAYRALKRGDFKDFLKNLRVEPRRKHRSWKRTVGKEAASVWLEYSYGWAPLLGDMYNALTVVTDTSVSPYWMSLEGAASTVHTGEKGVAGADILARRNSRVTARLSVKLGGDFRVSNFNLYLANRLGLINPAAVAWELVPFSSVADWFSNFGNVLSAVTDLYGVQHRYPYSTFFAKGQIEQGLGRGYTDCKVTFKGSRMRRHVGLTKPILIVPKVANFGSSFNRAANAVSLLVVLFIDD